LTKLAAQKNTTEDIINTAFPPALSAAQAAQGAMGYDYFVAQLKIEKWSPVVGSPTQISSMTGAM